MMKRYDENGSCIVCGWSPPKDGIEKKKRDHCPCCLSAVHREDEEENECGGILEPVGIWVRSDNEWEIIQRCSLCGQMVTAPVEQDDSPIKVLSIAARPLSAPPFPVEKLEELTKAMGGQGEIRGGDLL